MYVYAPICQYVYIHTGTETCTYAGIHMFTYAYVYTYIHIRYMRMCVFCFCSGLRCDALLEALAQLLGPGFSKSLGCCQGI